MLIHLLYYSTTARLSSKLLDYFEVIDSVLCILMSAFNATLCVEDFMLQKNYKDY